MTTRRKGRPRLREETEQLSLYLEASEAGQLLERPEGQSKTGVIAEALRIASKLKARAKEGCRIAAAALALVSSLEAPAAIHNEPSQQETHEIHTAAPQRPGGHEARTLPEQFRVSVVGSPEVGGPTAAAASGLPEQPEDLCLPHLPPEKPLSASDGASRDGNLAGSGGRAASERDSDRDLSADSPRPFPPKPRLPEHAYYEGRGVLISQAREALWNEYPEDLADIDAGAMHMSPVCAREAWAEYYAAHLSKRRRKTQEERAQPPQETPPPLPAPALSPEAQEIARYKAELLQIDSMRVIANAAKLGKLAEEEHHRRLAEIRKVSGVPRGTPETKAKRNDHPFDKPRRSS